MDVAAYRPTATPGAGARAAGGADGKPKFKFKKMAISLYCCCHIPYLVVNQEAIPDVLPSYYIS